MNTELNLAKLASLSVTPPVESKPEYTGKQNSREIVQVQVTPECLIQAYPCNRHGKTAYTSAKRIEVGDNCLPLHKKRRGKQFVALKPGEFKKEEFWDLEHRISTTPADAKNRINKASQSAKQFQAQQTET